MAACSNHNLARWASSLVSSLTRYAASLPESALAWVSFAPKQNGTRCVKRLPSCRFVLLRLKELIQLQNAHPIQWTRHALQPPISPRCRRHRAKGSLALTALNAPWDHCARGAGFFWNTRYPWSYRSKSTHPLFGRLDRVANFRGKGQVGRVRSSFSTSNACKRSWVRLVS